MCQCWRISHDGYHDFRQCPFYGMHWAEVAELSMSEKAYLCQQSLHL